MKNITLFLILFSINLFSQTIIKIDKENGVYKIPCKVNGVPMEFIFDTGATNVTISITEAKFLLKQGLLDKEDIGKSVEYQIANGEVEEGTEINLKEIQISDFIINDVKATIVYNQNAPLLLGLSALNKLGKVEFENETLKIYPKEYTQKEEKLDSSVLVAKQVLIKALSYGDENMVVKCSFEENYIGVHTLVEIDKPEGNYFDLTFSDYDELSKTNSFKQARLIIQKNGLWLKELYKSGYEIVAFMFDYFMDDSSKRFLYAVSTKKLLDLIEDFEQESFFEILTHLPNKKE